jgi:hypothetical protein
MQFVTMRKKSGMLFIGGRISGWSVKPEVLSIKSLNYKSKHRVNVRG